MCLYIYTRKGCGKEVALPLPCHIPSEYIYTDTSQSELFFLHLPRKMEPIEGSETSAFKPQTPGKHQKENILHKEHGESLKSRYFQSLSSKRNRLRQHHEIPVYLRLFSNKHSMSFKDLFFTLSKSLTPVVQYVYVFVHPLKTSVFTCLQDAAIM